jgi:tRNA-2-methylthio-N6-dimethylallyladenosine synthase
LTEQEKVKRLQILNQTQDEITLKRNQQLIESVQTILVEGPSKKSKPNQYMGRTGSNKIVVFDGDDSMVGSILDVRIVGAEGRTLFGEMI